MAEIIDILMPKYSECPAFVVNVNAATHKVPVTPFIPDDDTAQGFLYVSGSASTLIARFQSKDNLRILSAGFYIPECFTPANDSSKGDVAIPLNELMLLVKKSDYTFSSVLPGLGPRGVLPIPFLNYEIALDIFSNIAGVTLLADDCFYLQNILYCNDISMVGVPTVLNGDTIKVIPFIKVLHTKPIIADPAP